MMVEAVDPVISTLALRLRDRKLYKCFNVRALPISMSLVQKDLPKGSMCAQMVVSL